MFLIFTRPVCPAAQLVLNPVADTTLLEVAPSNSLGGAAWFSAGTTQNGTRNRGLMRFDVAAALPAGAGITSVTLVLTVTQQPSDGIADSLFSVRRVLRAWGEGTNVGSAQFPGFGSLAKNGDATWTDRFASSKAWAAPGALEGIDYSAAVSALRLVYGTGDSPYVFESNPDAVTDVQLWLDDPAQNFGWLLKAEDEGTRFTARRFGSREMGDPEVAPRLIIDFDAPARFTAIQRNGSSVQLDFVTGVAGPYGVDFRPAFASESAWMVLTNVGVAAAATNISVFDDTADLQRFYRVRRD